MEYIFLADRNCYAGNITEAQCFNPDDEEHPVLLWNYDMYHLVGTTYVCFEPERQIIRLSTDFLADYKVYYNVQ